MNYFNFFGIPVKFKSDDLDLKSKYQNYLKSNHPDFFVNEPEKHQEALQNVSLNNEAYRTLSHFYSRCHHVLKVLGYEGAEKLPPSFLMEMMDVNEQLEELQEKYNEVKRVNLENEIDNLSQNINDDLIKLTELADATEDLNQMPLEKIQENLLKHKYILRLKETLANIAAL